MSGKKAVGNRSDVGKPLDLCGTEIGQRSSYSGRDGFGKGQWARDKYARGGLVRPCRQPKGDGKQDEVANVVTKGEDGGGSAALIRRRVVRGLDGRGRDTGKEIDDGCRDATQGDGTVWSAQR